MRKALFGAWLFLYTALAFAGLNAPTYNGQPYFRATISTAQSVSTGVQTLVTWPSVSWDSGGYFNSGTNQYTPKVAGKYRVTAMVTLARTDTGADAWYFNAFINKNGSVVSANALGSGTSAMSGASILVTDTVSLNGSTDYLSITAQCQFPSGTCSVQPGTNSALTYWTVEYIGP